MSQATQIEARVRTVFNRLSIRHVGYWRERGRMHWRTPIIKVLASAFTLASGGSAGREGPIAQIGAGFGSMLAQVLYSEPDIESGWWRSGKPDESAR